MLRHCPLLSEKILFRVSPVALPTLQRVTEPQRAMSVEIAGRHFSKMLALIKAFSLAISDHGQETGDIARSRRDQTLRPDRIASKGPSHVGRASGAGCAFGLT